MKFYLCLHDFSELRFFLLFSWEIVFDVISGECLYLKL